MQIILKVSIKTIRKALALVGEDIPSDKKIKELLENTVIDLTKVRDENIKAAELGFCLVAIGQAMEAKK